MTCRDCYYYNSGYGVDAVCDTCDETFNNMFRPGLTVTVNLHGNPLPEKHGEWYDLCTSEDVALSSGQMAIIKLGISVKPPEGYHFLVASRSSTPLKYGLIIANGIGIIEDTYCGDGDILGLVVYATKAITIPKGTRIAQMTLVQKPPVFSFSPVDTMGEKDRGGYGSTGV